MDPGTAALVIGGGAISNATNFGLAQSAAGRSWDKWKDSQTRGPTYRLIGLEKAGLNPILAAKGALGGTAGTGQFPFAPGTQSGSNIGADIVQAGTANAQRQAAKSQARKLGAEADMAEQLAKYYKDNPKTLADREVNASQPSNVTGAITRGLFGGENPLFTPQALRSYIKRYLTEPGGPAKMLWEHFGEDITNAGEAALEKVKELKTEGPKTKSGRPRSGRKNTRNRERKK